MGIHFIENALPSNECVDVADVVAGRRENG
jgi:hypothetical protein